MKFGLKIRIEEIAGIGERVMRIALQTDKRLQPLLPLKKPEGFAPPPRLPTPSTQRALLQKTIHRLQCAKGVHLTTLTPLSGDWSTVTSLAKAQCLRCGYVSIEDTQSNVTWSSYTGR